MAEATAEHNKSSQEKATKGKSESTEEPKNEEPRKPAWSGNKTEEFSTRNIRERTFRMRSPTRFQAKDVLVSINRILQKAELETVSKQSTPGHWTMVTKSEEGANRLLLQDHLTIGPEHEKYRLEPRVQMTTLLTLPFVDPEITSKKFTTTFQSMDR